MLGWDEDSQHLRELYTNLTGCIQRVALTVILNFLDVLKCCGGKFIVISVRIIHSNVRESLNATTSILFYTVWTL
uniref:Uncharacterized protein n=1 Tax=Octopus bimaculoides TaxID=37653 RepID=A0A0L8HCU1_OCTBM